MTLAKQTLNKHRGEKLKPMINKTKSLQWKTRLKSLELKGWMKTIDAFCQKKIA